MVEGNAFELSATNSILYRLVALLLSISMLGILQVNFSRFVIMYKKLYLKAITPTIIWLQSIDFEEICSKLVRQGDREVFSSGSRDTHYKKTFIRQIFRSDTPSSFTRHKTTDTLGTKYSANQTPRSSEPSSSTRHKATDTIDTMCPANQTLRRFEPSSSKRNKAIDTINPNSTANQTRRRSEPSSSSRHKAIDTTDAKYRASQTPRRSERMKRAPDRYGENIYDKGIDVSCTFLEKEIR